MATRLGTPSLRHLLTAALLTLFATAATTLLAADPAPPKDLVGSTVDVKLHSGKTLKGMTVKEARPGKIPGTIAKLRLANPETGALTILGASAVTEVTDADGRQLLIFDAPSKSLAPPDADQLEAIHKAAADAPTEHHAKTSPPAKSPRTPKTRAAKSKKKQETPEEAEARRKQQEADRAAYFKKTGVLLWPEVTDDSQKEAIVQEKEFLKNVTKKFPSLNLKLYETKYFLFLTDLPPQWVELFTSCLDSMHEQLCTAYGITDKAHVWLGKLPVVAFSSSESFEECEKTFFEHAVDGKLFQGLAHKMMNGEVIVTCHCGRDPYYFACVLVHETTHGFGHRYKSAALLPSWLDEGLADWAAMMAVKKSNAVMHKIQTGLSQAKQQGNLGGNFFGDKNIEGWQYGIATSMTAFLMKSNPKGFRQMIDAIKQGTKWRQALKDAYGVTPAELTAAFGRSVGIPNLQP